ncbi:MAG: hypothetical protein JJU02_11130 [Cryomorphaceae bacterium]|nr:hypothetical protein [Cryomorphaceae bacterium]
MKIIVLFFVMFTLFGCQNTNGQPIVLNRDKDSIVFSKEIDSLDLTQTYYFENIVISDFDSIPSVFYDFIELLPDRSNYLIVMYTEGTVNEMYSVSPFVGMLEYFKGLIMREKPKIKETQFIFPEYLTNWNLKTIDLLF